MNPSPLDSAEALVSRARATAAKTPGTPLRSETMVLQHRELVSALEEVIEFHRGYAQEHHRLLLLVYRLRVTLIEGSNGTRFWSGRLSRAAKTALTSLNNYLRLSSTR
jgi:hypothetical protein